MACKAWEDAIAESREIGKHEGKIEGRIEGRIEGKREGKAIVIVEMGEEYNISKEKILIDLQEKLNISQEQAQEYYDQYSSK